MKILRLILGDQLNAEHSWYRNVDSEITYIIAEIRSETDYTKHHIQKITAFFLAMQNFSELLMSAGHKVIYLNLDQTKNIKTFSELIKKYILELDISHFEYQLPDEYRLDAELKKISSEINCTCKACDTEHFYTERDSLAIFFKGKKNYLMESFYRHLRKKEQILIDGQNPTGGKWNFDTENRKSVPKNLKIPEALCHQNKCTEIINRIKNHKLKTIGQISSDNLSWPVNRQQALDSLKYFCTYLLPLFGSYQDAMLTENLNLYHSRLSFALNVKILNPREVVNAAINEWQSRPAEIDITQIEGFIRQILGWREYMRGIYWARMPEYSSLNFFDSKKNLPDFFWTAKTKMNCLRQCIKNSLDNAYAHHIQRLMVTGNFAMLAGLDPDQVDQWYLGIYIDALEWVEITNTRGMSQYADGGIVGSKPYASSANYINRMSDYCKSCSYNNKLRYGDKACPFNSLYWNFFEKHKEKLSKNIRLSMVYKNLNNMDQAEKKAVMSQANRYLDNIENL